MMYRLTLLILQVSAALSAMVGNRTIERDVKCVCSVVMPDNIFPVERMEYLEATSQNLSTSVQTETLKVQMYGQTLSLYTQQLQNLTLRLQAMESGAGYTELQFDALRVEIQELLSLTSQLRSTVNGSEAIIERLHFQIKNMSTTVDQLETFDKHNVLGIRQEIKVLKAQQKKCEANQGLKPSQVNFGSCDHGGLLNVRGPNVVQLNWRGIGCTSGAWGRDPAPLPGKGGQYWVAPLESDRRAFNSYRLYSSYNDLLLSRNPVNVQLRSSSYTGQGSGMAMYKNYLYYNCYNSRYMCRMNRDTYRTQRTILNNATYNNRFSFSSGSYHDFDFAVDESGLWVVYATEASDGNMVVSKINDTSFTVEENWVTNMYKPSVSGTFMICGVLYAMRSQSTRLEEIFYTFDTKDGQEAMISVKMEKMLEKVSSVTYSPSDHKLFVYNQGNQMTYDVVFRPKG
ncbi:olfactomedin-4 [Callorhinchus milii]|nr:olfactomedin-4 [Callorhinchus milii]XP_007909264.1 olfactomedin-4 [Callorhinchus milii]|eukprot:gi/632984684/ref/XP_007909262.1/ PREDICTED: olfactomedin-4-like [Callorhinchus milii]